MTPEQWHLYVVNLEPRVGTKPGKQRPCICIQKTELCEDGLGSAIVIPLTTDLTKSEFFPIRVRIPKGTCGLKKDSDAMIDQIIAWDIAFFKEDLGLLPKLLIHKIKENIRDVIDV